MTYENISNLYLINDVDTNKVDALVADMLQNGFKGCPILVCGDELLTGSHRLAALHQIEKMYIAGDIEDEPEVLRQEVAEDVTDIVNENMANFEEKNGFAPDIDKSDIGWLLKDSWVEAYKNEIAEW